MGPSVGNSVRQLFNNQITEPSNYRPIIWTARHTVIPRCSAAWPRPVDNWRQKAENWLQCRDCPVAGWFELTMNHTALTPELAVIDNTEQYATIQ